MSTRESGAGPQAKTSLPPHPTLNRYYQKDAERPAYIRAMFDASARHYDLISSMMSFGTDKRYRRRALLDWGLQPGMSLLDVACGTGMVAGPAMEIVGAEGRVVGVEPSAGMLGEAVRKGRLKWALRGVAEDLPLADDSFDMVTMGFALRHVSDLLTAFREYRRVLKPGGKVLILEITRPPPGLAYRCFKLFMKSVIPAMTRVSTFNREAQSLMDYHWETVDQCVPSAAILEAMGQAGFEQVTRRIQATFCYEYSGMKPG
jgi:demethylmenaquinone methyltransferase/2-methoxy-6-polyprenyl-1,4-benzoquinol methylase